MLNIVTVQTGNYCGRGKEYTERLFSSLHRNLGDIRCRFFCLTDDASNIADWVIPLEAEPNVTGWWNKISLFRPGLFPKGERVLFSDLDAMPIGDLTDIASYTGPFGAVRDFYNKAHIQSCLMAWEAGTCDHIWETWNAGGKPQFDPRGDQAFIECMQGKADYWQDMFPGQVMSFKQCRLLGGIPSDTRLVCFHGRPRPHEINFELPTTSQKGN